MSSEQSVSGSAAFDVAVKDVDEITKEISVKIPVGVIKRKFDLLVTDAQKRVVIKGFRPGKAPKDLIEKLHGERLRSEVRNELVGEALSSAVRDNKIASVGSPRIEDFKHDTGADIQFRALIDILPQPEVKKYEKLSVKVSKREVNEAAIVQVLDQLRESKATTRPVVFRTKVEPKDVINGTVKVQIEGEEEARPEQVTIELGKGRLPKEIEEGLPGVAVGETKIIELTIDQNHQNQELRGKQVKYQVTVDGLAEKVLPEADDAFATGLGLGADTLLALRMKIREQLEAEYKKETKEEVHAEILNVLAADHDFKIPQSLVDDEIRSLLVRNGFIDTKKVDPSNLSMEPFREKLGEAAQKRVKTLILVDRIAVTESIQPSDDDINAALQQVADQNGVTINDVRKFFLSAERVDSFSAEVRRNKVLEVLEGRAAIEYVDPKPAA